MRVDLKAFEGTVDRLERVCDEMKEMFDRTLGMCAVCEQSSILAIHDKSNSFSHRFVRCEQPGDGL